MGVQHTQVPLCLDSCAAMVCKTRPSEPLGFEESYSRCDILGHSMNSNEHLAADVCDGSPLGPGVSYTSTADTRFDKIGTSFPPTKKYADCNPETSTYVQDSSYTVELEQRRVGSPGTSMMLAFFCAPCQGWQGT
jgi:hypothetical protein